MSNYQVDLTREIYEQHAFLYLQKVYPKCDITLNGHTNVGIHTRDIIVKNGKYKLEIEVKGAKAFSLGDVPRANRIVLQEKDIHNLKEFDFYLFVFNLNGFGESLFENEYCRICQGICNYRFSLVSPDKIDPLIDRRNKTRAIISVPKLIKLLNEVSK